MPTRVKICGITRVEDALTAARLGAYAIGLMFWPQSARYVTPAAAREIVAALPPFVSVVGVFVNPEREWVKQAISTAGLNMLQFHGDEVHETPEFCGQFSLPYIKAVRVREGLDLLQYATQYAGASGLLLDSYIEGAPGGTGQVFDWNLIPPHLPTSLPLPLILSGGLNPDNVTAAIKQVQPWAVDVSSGVERSKGIKDAEKIAAFMQGVSRSESI